MSGFAGGSLRLALFCALAVPVASAQAVSEEGPDALRRARFAPRAGGPVLTDLGTFYVGSRRYGEGLVDDALGTVPVYGFEYQARSLASGVGFEGALYLSSGEGTATHSGTVFHLDLDVYEAMLGGRYTQRVGDSSFYGFLGSGLDLLYADGDVRRTTSGITVTDGIDAVGYGAYVHAGLYVVLPEGWVFSLDVRQTVGTEVRSDPLEAHMNHAQIGIMIGSGF